MTARYTRTAISLHWLIAAGLIGMFCLGLYMTDLPFSPHKLRVYSWHKWAGVTIFVLVLARLAWRLTHPAPALPPTMHPALRASATAAHGLLYGLMLAFR
ncbi:MAG: Cytochrome b561 [Paracidovorax wautersii]|uniref:Cytochrome b561 n=1 Tax=Paracidovorax wautersii TaxID=1177982 RepID=A0A7V8FQM4_9BURK|nr:MAG: Cytochrome b561 [Paracidovorax wautersii]